MDVAYRFVFYRLYRWALRANGEGDLPHLTALFVLTLTEFTNLMTLAVMLGLGGVPVFENRGTAKVVAVAVLLALCLANYRYLIHGRRLDDIVDEFADTTDDTSRSGSLVASYVLGSFALFFGVGMVIATVRSG